MAIDTFVLVKAKLSEKLGKEWTDDDVRAYLANLKKTPDEWLEWDAKLSASICDTGKEPPDPEKDPEGYQHFLDSQYPGGH